ncbi:MAG: hypothetical protein R2726_10010 [Acidimicrobiales bacterium]
MDDGLPREAARELRYLAGVLDDFDAHHERRPTHLAPGEGEIQLSRARGYEEARERVVRPALDAVAWRLERRGHHAWLEALPAPEVLHADEEHEGELPDLAGLAFKVLPVADLRTAQHAPFLAFALNPRTWRIDCAIGGLDPGSDHRLRFDSLEPESVDAAAVARLAIILVEEVFLRRHRVLDEEPAGAGDWVPDLGGIIPTTGESRDWQEATTGAPGRHGRPRPRVERDTAIRPGPTPTPRPAGRTLPLAEDRQLPAAEDDPGPEAGGDQTEP